MGSQNKRSRHRRSLEKGAHFLQLWDIENAVFGFGEANVCTAPKPMAATRNVSVFSPQIWMTTKTHLT